MLRSESLVERRRAAQALARARKVGEDTVAATVAALDDPDELVRAYAVTALGRWGERSAPAVPRLAELLKNRHIAHLASLALGQIGPPAKGAVPQLIAAIEAPRGAQNAIWALGRIGPNAEAALPSIIPHLGDKYSGPASSEAIWSIGPKAVPALARGLERPDFERRVAILELLARFGPEAREAVPGISLLLKSGNSRVHYSAAEALSAAGSAGLAPLIEGLSEIDGHRRQVVALALAKQGPAAVPGLVEAFQRGDSRVKDGALKSLIRIGPPAKDAVPILVKALDAEDSFMRFQAVEALANIGPDAEAAIPALKRSLNQGDREHQAKVRGALKAIGPENRDYLLPVGAAADAYKAAVSKGGKEIPGTDAALRSENAYLRAQATRSLPGMGAASVPILILSLRDRNYDVRATAADELGGMGPAAKEAVPALARALRDVHFEVRWRAAGALKDLGIPDRRAVAALTESLNDEVGFIRTVAAEALARMGGKAETAIPALIEIFKRHVEESSLGGVGCGSFGEGLGGDTESCAGAGRDSFDAAFRRTALKTLLSIGPDSPSVTAVLKAARNDPDPETREIARHGVPGRSGSRNLNGRRE